MINDLNDAMRQGKGKDVLGKIDKELVGYTVTHFRTEEKSNLRRLKALPKQSEPIGKAAAPFGAAAIS